MYMNLEHLREIINTKHIKPTINNEKSNFVVVTYWWGNNIKNQNTSRPCISFFEKLNSDIQKLCLKILGTTQKDIKKIYDNLEKSIVKLKAFEDIIDKTAKSYTEMIPEHLGLQNEPGRVHKSIVSLEKMKTKDQTPREFEHKTKEAAAVMFTRIMVEAIKLIKKKLLIIFDTNKQITELREKFLSKQELITPAVKKKMLKEIDDLNKKLTSEKADIKKILNTKHIYDTETMQEFNEMSIYEILHKEFRFLSPMTYDKMIEKWERECAKFKCNHMAVEYPEFAKPGGYQMAINAKPLFIQKALESCGHRSVLYIDGDMFIRKYPHLFDLTDVDFMARGWLIDPRSSWKMEESITYDPYTFETSGGTMFFSQSQEAKQLIHKWIEISSKSYQIGKADDRILSLVFNTYKFLCSMKIIQLPVEYLWLTLDYDERMLDGIYDGDKYAMADSILIEHSECLTSEDTATGSGAASDRTPKFYGYLEENVEPVSEQFHEYIMFPSAEMAKLTFGPYLTYMAGVHYLNDGNELLLKKGLVSLDNQPEENEQPLYIIQYNDKFGSMPYPHHKKLSYNQVAQLTQEDMQKVNVKDYGLANRVEINEASIPVILKLLLSGKTVIYNPIHMIGYDKAYYELLLDNEKTKYQSMELIFAPEFKKEYTVSANYFYKPKIQTNQAILFKPSDILIKFLRMFLVLDHLSEHINNGSYEFMSRIRVGYLIKKNTSRGSASARSIASSPARSIASSPVNSIKSIDAAILRASIEDNAQILTTNSGPKSGPKSVKTLTPKSVKTLTPKSVKTLTPVMVGGGGVSDIDLYNKGLHILYEESRSKLKRRTAKMRRTNMNKTIRYKNY